MVSSYDFTKSYQITRIFLCLNHWELYGAFMKCSGAEEVVTNRLTIMNDYLCSYEVTIDKLSFWVVFGVDVVLQYYL